MNGRHEEVTAEVDLSLGHIQRWKQPQGPVPAAQREQAALCRGLDDGVPARLGVELDGEQQPAAAHILDTRQVRLRESSECLVPACDGVGHQPLLANHIDRDDSLERREEVASATR